MKAPLWMAVLALVAGGCRSERLRAHRVEVGEVGVEIVYDSSPASYRLVSPGGQAKGFALPTSPQLLRLMPLRLVLADGHEVEVHLEVLWRVSKEGALQLVEGLECRRAEELGSLIQFVLHMAARQSASECPIDGFLGAMMPQFLDALLIRARSNLPKQLEIASVAMAKEARCSWDMRLSRRFDAMQRRANETALLTEQARDRNEAWRKQAETEATKALGKALTSELVELERARKWNGVLPQHVAGGMNGPFTLPYQ